MQYTSPFILIAPSRYACFREITTSRPSALLTLDDIQPSREPGPEHRMTMMYIQMAAAVKLNNHVHDCSLVNFDYTCAQVANCLRAAKHFLCTHSISMVRKTCGVLVTLHSIVPHIRAKPNGHNGISVLYRCKRAMQSIFSSQTVYAVRISYNIHYEHIRFLVLVFASKRIFSSAMAKTATIQTYTHRHNDIYDI